MVSAVSGCSSDTRALLRIVVRVVSNPQPGQGEQHDTILSVGSEPLLARLRRALPDVPEDDLRFRSEATAGILHFLASGSMRVDIESKTETELERLLAPVVTGALAGGLER